LICGRAAHNPPPPKERLLALHVGSPQLSTPSEGTAKANVVSASALFGSAICQPDILINKKVPGRIIALKSDFALTLLSRRGLLIAAVSPSQLLAFWFLSSFNLLLKCNVLSASRIMLPLESYY
jgi:hypothetical protein